MSYDSQRGYLFGILQRGARSLGRATYGHRVLSGQRALEHSSTVNHSSATSVVDRFGKSSPAVEVDTGTPGSIRAAGLATAPTQTRDSSFDQGVLTPAAFPSESPPAVEVDSGTPGPIRSADFPTATTQTLDSSFDQVELTPAAIPSESAPAVEVDTGTPSPIRSAGFSAATTQTPDSSSDQLKLTPDAFPSESSPAVEVNTGNPRPIRSADFATATTHAPDSSFDHAELTPSATPSESFPPVELNSSTQSRIHMKRAAHPQMLRSEPHSRKHAADVLPGAATDARPTDLSMAATRTDHSTFDHAKLHSTARDANVPPTADPVHITVIPAPADSPLSEPRLPRLFVIEQGGKAISFDNSSSDAKEAARSIIVEESGEVFERQRRADLRTANPGPLSSQRSSSHAATIRSSASLNMTRNQDSQIVNREMSSGYDRQGQAEKSLQADISEPIETVSSLAREVNPGEHLPTSKGAPLNRSHQPDLSQSVHAIAPPDTPAAPVARFRARPSDASGEETGVTRARAHAERIEECFVRRGSLPAQTEEPCSRGPSSPQQPRAAPRLTINRLDVEIVNQSPAPTAPAPPAPAPAAAPLSSERWENLERHQLGHLHLIF